MTITRTAWAVALTVALAAGPASAQDFSYAAEPAKKKFDTKVEELRAKYQTEMKAASAEYATKLDELIKGATEKGDLDKVLAYKAEKEWAVNGKLPMDTAASVKIVQAMRAAYETKKKAANTAYEKAAKAAHAEFIADLDAVVKEETKEGRIESALKVRDTKKEVEKASLPAAVAPAKPLVKEVPPVKPDPVPAPVPKPEPTTTTKPDPKATIKPAGDFSWEKAIANPAQVEIKQIGSFVLDAKVTNPFVAPERFTKNRAIIYGSPKDKYAGVADIKVLSDGYLFLACNFKNQGNSSGGWLATRWLAPQFVENGWKKLDNKDFAAEAGQGADAAKGFEFFVKYVKKDEEMKLRCNKYMPPYAIVFSPEAKK